MSSVHQPLQGKVYEPQFINMSYILIFLPVEICYWIGGGGRKERNIVYHSYTAFFFFLLLFLQVGFKRSEDTITVT